MLLQDIFPPDRFDVSKRVVFLNDVPVSVRVLLMQMARGRGRGA